MSNEDQQPPRLSRWMIRSFFRDGLEHSAEGDMAEVHRRIARERGYRAADNWYRIQTIRSIPAALGDLISWRASMMASNLKSARRFMWRFKGYTAINVLGLSIALSVAMLSALLISTELSYDRFHLDSDRIYRVGTTIALPELQVWENTPFQLADALDSSVPGVDQSVRLTQLDQKPLRTAESVEPVNVTLVSPEFFDFFRFPLLSGETTSLKDPSRVVLSEREAYRLFGDLYAVGKSIELNLTGHEWETFTVAGVADNPPDNSSINFNVVVSETYFPRLFGEPDNATWLPKSRTVTFFRANEQADIATVTASLDRLGRDHGLQRFLRGHEAASLFPVEPLHEVHFSDLIGNSILKANGDITRLYIVGCVALLLVLIAGINFVNLALGLANRRARDVGVRKAFGAMRSQVAEQHTTESLVVSAVALVAALGLTWLQLPLFNRLTGMSVEFGILIAPLSLLFLVSVACLLGLVAGAYPAVVLASFRPMTVLRGHVPSSGKHLFGQVMVGVQFAISIFLIGATLIMVRQLQYVSSEDVGFDSDLVVVQDVPRGIDDAQLAMFKSQAMTNSSVAGVAGARATLFGESVGSLVMVTYQNQPARIAASKIDYDFIDVLGLTLVAGRNLSPDFPADAQSSVLVNEAFVDAYIDGDPIDAVVPFDILPDSEAHIVGVVADYHFMSMHHSIQPMMLNLRPDSDYRQVLLKIRGERVAETLAMVQREWDAMETGMPFTYSFLDEAVAGQYEADQRFRTMCAYAAWIAILVACLGLLGMTALATARRTREIGIRRVLGASTAGILLLLNRGFAPLLVGASLVAGLTIFVAMDRWLAGFAYRIDIGVEAFLLPAALVGAVAVTTICLQAISAAMKRPTDVLRAE
ncbi:MAG: ABC transporter permease [Rhodothermales bacterium]